MEKQGKGQGQSRRDALRRASQAGSHAHTNSHEGCKSTVYYASNLWESGHAIRVVRLLPTLQSVFLDRIEGPLGL
jgi:hypothetical protein